MKRTAVGVATLSFEVTLTDAGEVAPLQLLPAGSFRARDGRPTECAAWICTAEVAQRLIAQANADARRIVIDYEHQTLNAEKNGQPAPAAGFFKQMDWREGNGLFAIDTDWTDRARQMIGAREYIYLSPVFTYDRHTGEVLQILHAALTNFPALDGMSEVALRAAAHFQLPLDEENTMPQWLIDLLKKLGLNDHTEAGATAGLTALKALADSAQAKDTEIAALNTKVATIAGKDAEIAALKSSGGHVDPAMYVPIEAMAAVQQQVAALSAQVQGRDVDELVAGALSTGKLLPAQESWAKELGAKDIASLRAFLDKAQPIAALKGMQTEGKTPSGQPRTELSEGELAVCRSMGIDPEAYKKSLAEQA